jgi:L-rhamnose mutarotase
MLTIKKLKKIKPYSIFATGETKLVRYLNYPEEKVRWVAERGKTYDWAIYYGNPICSFEYIRSLGDKLHDGSKIRELVPCDDATYLRYRD